MKAAQKYPYDRLNLRFEDPKLRHRIEAAAKKARRSRNSEILTRLEQSLDAEERKSAST